MFDYYHVSEVLFAYGLIKYVLRLKSLVTLQSPESDNITLDTFLNVCIGKLSKAKVLKEIRKEHNNVWNIPVSAAWLDMTPGCERYGHKLT